MSHLRFPLLLLLALTFMAPLTMAQEKQPQDNPAETKATKLNNFGSPDSYFQLQYSDAWKVTSGQGYIELRGKKGDAREVWIRVYALGLRSVGGKFRDLEHVVNDMIFQVRDEFKGKVGKKQWQSVGRDKAIKARTLTGEQPMKKGKIKIDFYAAEHPEHKGVIISFSYAGPPKAFTRHHEEALKILNTLAMKPLGAPFLPATAKHEHPTNRILFQLTKEGWKAKSTKSGFSIQGPEGITGFVDAKPLQRPTDSKKIAQQLESQFEKAGMKVAHTAGGPSSAQTQEIPFVDVTAMETEASARKRNPKIKNPPRQHIKTVVFIDDENKTTYTIQFEAPSEKAFQNNALHFMILLKSFTLQDPKKIDYDQINRPVNNKPKDK